MVHLAIVLWCMVGIYLQAFISRYQSVRIGILLQKDKAKGINIYYNLRPFLELNLNRSLKAIML